MYNKINVDNMKRKWIARVFLALLLFTILAAVMLFVFRAMDTRNYSGQVIEVSGVVTDVNYNGADGIEVTLNDDVYNGNIVRNFDENFDFSALVGASVTLYVPQKQVGSGLTWIVGIKQGDVTLIDYEQLIAKGKAENKLAMVIAGVICGVFAVATCVVFVWQSRIPPTKEEEFYKIYCEISAQRQPNCPQFKKLNLYLLIYIAYTLLICVAIALLGSLVENETVLIAVCVPLGVGFVALTAGMFVVLDWVVKKEREFYAENFPFDFTDLSHVAIRKKFKEELQANLKADRERHPHRYGDGANSYVVEFCDMGLKFYYYDPSQEYDEDGYPTTEEVFGVVDPEKDAQHLVCTLDYETLNFVALPHYRKKDRPLTVVIKSRLVKSSLLPETMVNDVHLILDSNLLATLRKFNVPVENLDYVLDNKEQLIAENCPKAKTVTRLIK